MAGYDAVVDSWRDVLHNQETHYRGRIAVSDIRIVCVGEVAWVTCLEAYEQEQGVDNLEVAATNVFRQQSGEEGGNWLLLHRLASRIR